MSPSGDESWLLRKNYKCKRSSKSVQQGALASVLQEDPQEKGSSLECCFCCTWTNLKAVFVALEVHLEEGLQEEGPQDKGSSLEGLYKCTRSPKKQDSSSEKGLQVAPEVRKSRRPAEGRPAGERKFIWRPVQVHKKSGKAGGFERKRTRSPKKQEASNEKYHFVAP